MDSGKRVSPIVLAIQSAEEIAPIQIRVILSRSYFELNPLKCCEKWFYRLKLDQGQFTNGVLLYVNLRRRKFAIYSELGSGKPSMVEFWNAALEDLQVGLHETYFENAIASTLLQISKSFKIWSSRNKS